MENKNTSEPGFPFARSTEQRIEAIGLTKLELVSAIIISSVISHNLNRYGEANLNDAGRIAIDAAKLILSSLE